MITLIISPGEQIAKIQKKLVSEQSKAVNIKSKVNRQSVESALVTIRERLKLYDKIPKNGLFIYCGTFRLNNEKSDEVHIINIVPFKPINYSIYICAERFNVQPLKELIQIDQTYGFIIVSGEGALFATLQGTTKIIKRKFDVFLPNKHSTGGQSAVRFERNRQIARHNYLRKVCEEAIKIFITNDRPNVAGLVIAGMAELKTKLLELPGFDPRLKKIVLKIVDVSYKFEAGLNEAISQSEETLLNVKYVQEKKLIAKFFEEINKDSKKIIFGIEETMTLFENGIVDMILASESLDYTRVSLKSKENTQKVQYMRKSELPLDAEIYKNSKTGLEYKVQEVIPINEYLLENYKKFGSKLKFISEKSPEGNQFAKGFGGCGGFLRYDAGTILLENYQFNGEKIEITDQNKYDIDKDFE